MLPGIGSGKNLVVVGLEELLSNFIVTAQEKRWKPIRSLRLTKKTSSVSRRTFHGATVASYGAKRHSVWDRFQQRIQGISIHGA
jgi:hypothetical protein